MVFSRHRRPDRSRALGVALAAGLACVCIAQTAGAAAVTTAPPAAKPDAPRSHASKTETAAGLPAGNAQQPINLEAASSDFDYKNNSLQFRRVKITQGALEVTAQEASASGLEFANAEWRLTGDVRISLPGGLLQSDDARVKFQDNAIVSALIKGSPAQFEQRLKENNQLARGRAASIDYNVKQGTVLLTGDAWLTDGQNEINGNTLIYDIGRERVLANPNEKDPGGVHITINPPAKKTTPPPAKGDGT